MGEAKNERVRESVNPLDGCTRPFGFAKGGRSAAADLSCAGRFFQRDADVQDPRLGFRLKCSEVQNESTAHVLAASHGRCQILTEACVFVMRAV